MKPFDLMEIKQKLKEKNINYDKLSIMTKIPKSTLSQIMCGYIKKPSHESIIKICSALDINIDNQKIDNDSKILSIYNQLSDFSKDMLISYATYMLENEKGNTIPSFIKMPKNGSFEKQRD